MLFALVQDLEMNASRTEEFETVAAVNRVQAVVKVSMHVGGKNGYNLYQR